MNTDYGALSADQLLAALEQAGRSPDLALIHTCLERQEELTPELLEMLAEDVDYSWHPDDPRWYRDVHAGLLLIAFREPAALPIFAELFRDEERENLLEWFGTELPAYGPAAIPMLMDLANDDTAYDHYPRAAAIEMLTGIALHHPSEQERIAETFRDLLPPLKDDGTLDLPPDVDFDEVWTWAASGLADLRDTVSQPQIIALYEQGLIDEFVRGGLEDYLAEFKPGARPPLAASREYDVMKTYEWLSREVSKQTERKAESAPTVARSQPKVGRNDPCPCGSGRKYKHCCGSKRR